MRYFEYLAIISSQIWDLCPADVSSCVNGVELCVGYDDVETQRIVWDQAKRCCLQWAKFELMLPKVQRLAHLASPGKYRLQNNKSFSKENAVIFIHQIVTTRAYSLLKVEWYVMCNLPKLRKQVPFADWRKYVLMRQYPKNIVSVKFTVERPGKASSIYREDEKKTWAKWYHISFGVFLSPGVDGSLRFYHKGIKWQEIIYWLAVMEKRHSHLFLVFCWRISPVDNLDWKQIGLFS